MDHTKFHFINDFGKISPTLIPNTPGYGCDRGERKFVLLEEEGRWPLVLVGPVLKSANSYFHKDLVAITERLGKSFRVAGGGRSKVVREQGMLELSFYSLSFDFGPVLKPEALLNDAIFREFLEIPDVKVSFTPPSSKELSNYRQYQSLS